MDFECERRKGSKEQQCTYAFTLIMNGKNETLFYLKNEKMQ